MLDFTRHAKDRLSQRLKTVRPEDIKVEDLQPVTKSIRKRFASEHPRSEQAFDLAMREMSKKNTEAFYHKGYDSLFMLAPIGNLGKSYHVITIIPSKKARAEFS